MARTSTFRANESTAPYGLTAETVVEAPAPVEPERVEQDFPAGQPNSTWKVAEIDAYAAAQGVEVEGTKNKKLKQLEVAAKAAPPAAPADAETTDTADDADDDSETDADASEPDTTEE